MSARLEGPGLWRLGSGREYDARDFILDISLIKPGGEKVLKISRGDSCAAALGGREGLVVEVATGIP